MNDKYTVYIHISPSNKKYIGITSQNVKKRWQNGYGYKTNKYFWRAIQKYGWDNFEHEILFENLTVDEAKEKEIELIKLYNTYRPNGYNLTFGGDNISEKIFSEETRKKISNALKGRTLSHETKQKISNASNGENNYWYGKKLSQDHKNKIGEKHKGMKASDETRRKMSESHLGKTSIKIYQYDLDGNFIKEWVSATEVSRILKLNQSNISGCCTRNRNECGGYQWRFYKKDKIEPYSKRCYKKVSQKTKEGVLIKTYKSATDAAKELTLDSSSIIKCCKGKSQTCGGFKWEYA